ncbi:hypothetical protein GDO81_028089 [Engystomops pustulosus]|uniref:Uncharacterized protein n=1 Tax=Engystomops pustulosus TaxID=76066 RepID=A0AAV6ZLB0_ENGPU|nr:hypothetical protein GDO81_028089 [Engystomops pustulosus]
MGCQQDGHPLPHMKQNHQSLHKERCYQRAQQTWLPQYQLKSQVPSLLVKSILPWVQVQVWVELQQLARLLLGCQIPIGQC